MSNQLKDLSPDQAAVVEKIRKILSKVTHTGGATATPEAEVQAALAMARKMMDKFDIDEGLYEALVQGSDASRQAAYDTIIKDVAFSRKDFTGAEFFIRIANAVECVCDVKLHQERRTEKNPQAKRGETHSVRHCLDFYGMPRDVAVARALYTELIATMHAMARLKYGTGWSKDHSSYSFGIGDRLASRAREAAAARKSAPGDEDAAKAGAIVVCKDRLLERWEWEHIHGGSYWWKPEWLKTEAEKAKDLAEQEESTRKANERQAEHERRMKDDPEYRKQYERERAKWAKRKGPRGRTVNADAYYAGHADAGEISLGVNGIGGSTNVERRGQIE